MRLLCPGWLDIGWQVSSVSFSFGIGGLWRIHTMVPGTWAEGRLRPSLAEARWPSAVGRRGAGEVADQPGGCLRTGPQPSALRLSYLSAFFIIYKYKILDLVWLMGADPSLPGWGGRSAPPPQPAEVIQRRMIIILLRLAKRRRKLMCAAL